MRSTEFERSHLGEAHHVKRRRRGNESWTVHHEQDSQRYTFEVFFWPCACSMMFTARTAEG